MIGSENEVEMSLPYGMLNEIISVADETLSDLEGDLRRIQRYENVPQREITEGVQQTVQQINFYQEIMARLCYERTTFIHTI